MANGLSQFSKDHHYASGLVLLTVGVVGVVGSATGTLANMLAALWVPDALFTDSGSQADSGGVNSPSSATNIWLPLIGPVGKWLTGL